jgi:hypothetical protein
LRESGMTRILVAVLAALCLGVVCAADPPPSGTITGKVLEAKDAAGYTYLRLGTRDGERWAAVAQTAVKPGAEVTVNYEMVMEDFESKALNRKFDRIVFGTVAGQGAGTAAKGTDMAAMHSGVAKAADPAPVKVAKATGPEARTVAEIVSGRAGLKDKGVVVRGKVVKFTPGVLGKNWVHLRDGTGSAADGSNDVLVTTADEVAIGDVVLAKGVVRIDRDFGSGYSYAVLVEDATLRK